MKRDGTIDLPYDGPEHRHCRGPRGRRHCRFCGVEVPRSKKTWCGDACVAAYEAIRTPRIACFARDRGRCTACGLDAARLEAAYHRITTDPRVTPEERIRRQEEAGEALLRRGFRLDRSFWEADHVVAVVEGGPHTPDNLRTLCLPCHKRDTRALLGRIAARRRARLQGAHR